MRYDLMTREALREVVRLALEKAASQEGLPGNHHFYVGFVTRAPGVSIPDHLLEQHPDQMTIVFKRHFWDLVVNRDGFSVTMSFHQKAERILVPFSAVVTFVDPVVNFGLQFPSPDVPAVEPAESSDEGARSEEAGAEVVSLDAFRKK